MDPLSDVLSLLKLRTYMSGGFDAGGDWSIAFGQHDGIKFYAAVSGACWLVMDGVPDAVRVESGDCLLLPSGRAFRVASDPALTPIDAFTVFTAEPDGGITRINGGGDFFSVGGYFALTEEFAGALVGLLPPIVHIRNESDQAVLRWSIERMRQELREPRPGGDLIARQLATMMLVQALRLHLADGSRSGVGWLFALADRRMSAAITAMHREPGHRWTVQEMADRAGMSRTTFTLRFRKTVGASPMEYLTRWRMMLAGDQLTNSADPISEIARALGYESESAFSTAFKRVMGCSPRQYGRDRPPALAAPHAGRSARANRLEPAAE